MNQDLNGISIHFLEPNFKPKLFLLNCLPDQLDDFIPVLIVNLADVFQGALVALQMDIYLVPPVGGRGEPFQLIQEREIFLGILLRSLRHEQNL